MDKRDPVSIDGATRLSRARRRRLSIGFLLGGAIAALVIVVAGSRLSVVRAVDPAPVQDEGIDFSKFLHSSSRHSSVDCATCHRRQDNSTQPTLPGHSACNTCHLAQFTTPNIPMCMICHANVDSGNPPVKTFPQSFKENFNMKFDHAQHNTGDARPEGGCASCHTGAGRRAAALSIPRGIGAHGQCYVCHTPDRQAGGRNIGSCATCHAQAGYQRASTNAAAFRASFSHAEHGPRQRLGCADCHNPIAGAPQPRQLSSPRTAEHFGSGRAQSCMTCHNGRRAFGDEKFGDCKRCHKGQTFQM